MKTSCCYKCVPPKRHPGCHARCEEYLAERAKKQEQKAIADMRRSQERDMVGYDIEKGRRLRDRYGVKK